MKFLKKSLIILPLILCAPTISATSCSVNRDNKITTTKHDIEVISTNLFSEMISSSDATDYLYDIKVNDINVDSDELNKSKIKFDSEYKNLEDKFKQMNYGVNDVHNYMNNNFKEYKQDINTINNYKNKESDVHLMISPEIISMSSGGNYNLSLKTTEGKNELVKNIKIAIAVIDSLILATSIAAAVFYSMVVTSGVAIALTGVSIALGLVSVGLEFAKIYLDPNSNRYDVDKFIIGMEKEFGSSILKLVKIVKPIVKTSSKLIKFVPGLNALFSAFNAIISIVEATKE